MVQDQPEQKLVGIHLNQQMGMVAQSCDPSYTGDRDRKTMVQGQPSNFLPTPKKKKKPQKTEE
jgi:hypothetical protein